MAKLIKNAGPNYVFGRVTDTLNRPLPGLKVRVSDRDMRSEELLEETFTDQEGRYEIIWHQRELDGRGRRTADIAVKVLTPERDTLLFTSDMDQVRFNAGRREEINIVIRQAVPTERVEYDHLLREVRFLANQVAIVDLQESEQQRDITFLSRETGYSTQQIEHLVVAHRMEVASQIEAAFFYALLHQNTLLKNDWVNSTQIRLNIGLDTDTLPLLYDAALTDAELIKKDVRAAEKSLIISEKIAKESKKYTGQLRRFRDKAEAYYREEHPRRVLETVSAFITDDKLGEMGRLFKEHNNDLDTFFQKINDPAFFQSDKEQDPKVLSLLRELLGFDRGLIDVVKKAKSIETPTDVRRLAAMDPLEWKNILSEAQKTTARSAKQAGERDMLDFRAFMLARKMEAAFPTTAFAAQLGREQEAQLPQQSEIVEWFQQHEDFDLINGNVDLYQKDRQQKRTAATPMPEGLREEIKSIQRIFKLAPNYRQTMGLRAQNIRSAQHIAALGERQFVQKIAPKAGIEPAEAKKIFLRAERAHTGAMLLAGELQDMLRANDTAALRGNGEMALKLTRVAADFPDLKTLFQLTDQCACEHCRSVYSPAAYLVEVLQFLDKRETLSGVSAKQKLFERRPDLGDIDLGCENANTPVPYIDLVCELLEAEIAKDEGIPYAGPLSDGPDPLGGTISALLLAALEAQNVPVTEKAQIFKSETTPLFPHYLRDSKAVCRIEEETPGNYRIFRLRQTLSSAEELAAAPEYVNEAAYIELKNQDYAFKLPFDLDHTEAKAYFSRFGISRTDLMQDFQVAAAPSDAHIAAERLRLTDRERALITEEDVTEAGQQAIWNVPGNDPLVPGVLADYMKRLDHFLDKTGLTYKQADLLLSLSWTDDDDSLFIKHNDSSCDTAQKEIAGLGLVSLDRIHRFLRWHKKSGWRFEILDEIIVQPQLGAGILDDNCLIHAANLVQITEQITIPVEELIGFYGFIPHTEYLSADKKPLYHQVFLNKAKNGFVDERLLPGNIDNVTPLTTLQTSLAVCLQTSEAELAQLLPLTAMGGTHTEANLSFLFGATRLMRKLKLKAADFVTLRQLTGILFEQSPAATLAFVKAAKDAVELPLKLADVKFMLRHEAENLVDRDIKDEKISAILTKLQKELQRAFTATKSPFDAGIPSQEQLKALQMTLSGLEGVEAADVQKMVAFFEAQWTDALGNYEPLAIAADLTPANAGIYLSSIMPVGLNAAPVSSRFGAIDSQTQAFATEQANYKIAADNLYAAQQALALAPGDPTVLANLAIAAGNEASSLANVTLAEGNVETARKDLLRAFFAEISRFQFQNAKKLALAQIIVTNFKADLALVELVIQYAQLKQLAGSPLMRSALLSDTLIDTVNPTPVLPALTTAAFPDQVQALRLLHKMLPFMQAFKLDSSALDWHFQNNSNGALNWFLWDEIPCQSGQSSVNYDRFVAFSKMTTLSKTLTAVPNPADAENTVGFYTVFNSLIAEEAPSVFLGKLALLLNAEYTSVEALHNHLYSPPDIGGYAHFAQWEKLETCLEYLRLLNSPVANIEFFIQSELTSAEVKMLRAALKSRYDEDTWLGVLKEIMDAIRPQKRDALVAYLLAKFPDFKNENDLYDFFLVDVEMEACMPSSRIVQAHGVVQLFTQRCLMGLEPGTIADVEDDPNWEQWKWMKNYRVWEANRKIFLYPENWLEPELRHDKSFLFTELENELQQNELTDSTAEEALIKYLEKLDNIAFLEVMATWYETHRRTMHVFARTKGGDPSIYYYRKFEKEQYWTPWEKVELDITGDHLLAFVRNNRLTLAWPVFTEEPDPEQTSDVPSESDAGVPLQKPARKLKIQLATSEFANKKWQPKRVSKDAILTPDNPTTDDEDLRTNKYNLTYLEFTDQVWIFHSTLSASPMDVPEKQFNQWENHRMSGIFDVTGCKGYPELSNANRTSISDFLPDFKRAMLTAQRYHENSGLPENEFAIRNGVSFIHFMELLERTPNNFRVSYPHQFTFIDFLALLFQLLVLQSNSTSYADTHHDKRNKRRFKIPYGTFLPYFMEDSLHNYVVIPGFYRSQHSDSGETREYEKRTVSDIFQLIEDITRLYNRFFKEYNRDINLLINDQLFSQVVEELILYTQMRYGEQFKNMYHPLVCPLRAILYRDGVPGLMKREVQRQQTDFNFQTHYQPTQYTPHPYPVEDIDFAADGSYSHYNWELFYHIPYLIATRLTKNQRFEEAMKWFHYIFNPTGALSGPVPQKYWVTKPFYERQSTEYISERIDALLYSVANPLTPDKDLKRLEFAIDQWKAKPFLPYVVAGSRTVAHQKAVLIKYIDNLTEWGDYLFRQDTMESIVQATQMYILADKLLGQKPRVIPPLVKPPYETYNQIEAKLDAFGNAIIGLENILPNRSVLPEGGAELPESLSLSLLYFCIPQNEKMLEIWDKVADRLFKIRHCQNIDGVERQLALFAPPIDPGALARAAAGGLDISAVLAGINAPIPYYRFNVLSQKATELINEVRSLGSSLLQVLEKKDAEAMALLRNELEIKVLNAVREMKKLQINESKEQIEVLRRTKMVTEERKNFYASIQKINAKEQLNLNKLSEAQGYQFDSQIIKTIAGALALIPEFHLGANGFGGSPEVVFQMGGSALSKATNIGADILNVLSGVASYEANRASILGGYDRRFDDWKLQERLAQKELASIDKQILAAEIRRDIATTDLNNHDLQIENAKRTDEFMRTKYTNRELYEWMQGQISSVYFQAYQLAHDFAKKAERCYRFELGNDDSFIKPGYWDSLKKGLQSADHLLHDLKRMETGYLDKNQREYEITKHISLALLDPISLARLRATGSCDFDIPEALFDMDFAGQYFRRIKSVSVSLPCVAGPYTSVSAKLSLVKNKYRKNINPENAAGTGYLEDPGNDERFVYNLGAIQSIAASSGQNDSGVFELNFRDERYLPFENTGAISSWRLELPQKGLAQFNYDTLSDVVIHLKYTAREGGSTLKGRAEENLKTQLNALKQGLQQQGMHIALNLKHDMPNEWHLLKQQGFVEITIEKIRLPYLLQMLTDIEINSVLFMSKSDNNPASVVINIGSNPVALAKIDDSWRICRGKQTSNTIAMDTSFRLSIASGDLEHLEGLMMMVKVDVPD